MPRPSKHFLSLVNMPEDSGMSLKEYFYKKINELNKERYYLGTDTEEKMERHKEIACTLHSFSKYKPYNWPSVVYRKIAKEPISLDTPIGDDEDSQLKDFSEDPFEMFYTEDVGRSKLRHPRKSKLLEKIRKENNES